MRPDITLAKQRAERSIESGQSLIVRGPVGSGLHTLADELRRTNNNIVLIELLDLEHPDAPAAGLLQAIAAVPDRALREGFITSLGRTEDTARQVAGALHQAGKSLVVLVPPTSGRGNDDLDEDDLEEDDSFSRVRSLLRGLTNAAVPFLVIADQQVDLSRLGVASAPEEKLHPYAVRLQAGEAWGTYAPYARELGESLAPSLLASPLVWRLAVGAIALRAPISMVREHCRRPAAEAFQRLVGSIAERLKEQPRLFQSVRRALQIRRAEAAELLARTTRIPEDHLPLLTECLGYGEPVRFPPALRAELATSLGSDDLGPALPDLHLALAAHYQQLDGVADPKAVQSPSQMVAWVERAHHLAFAGEQGADAWKRLELPAPEFYRDRARALSVQYRKYAEAAQVYLDCVKKFPEDDYSHHYAAWNLERAKGDLSLARKEYEAAIDRAEENPWWNARYITFLIRTGAWPDARAAWQRALQKIDPDGTATSRSPWLASHLHYWVAGAWRDAGAWWEARRTIESVPERMRRRSRRKFTELEQDIRSVEQHERRRFSIWLAAQVSAQWETAQALWANIEQEIPGLPLPTAGPGEDGRAQLAWSLPDLYLEIEVDAGARLFWYWRDLEAGSSEAGEGDLAPIPRPLHDWLEQLSHA